MGPVNCELYTSLSYVAYRFSVCLQSRCFTRPIIRRRGGEVSRLVSCGRPVSPLAAVSFASKFLGGDQ